MKIMICGSMTFAKEMIEAQGVLEEMGHSVKIPTDSLDIVNGEHNHDDLEADYNHCIENDIMRTHFKLIEESDAVIVLNYDKNNIKGYIGTASLMEIGLAHHLKKKIFLLNPLPSPLEYRWVHEVRIVEPTILNGDLSKVGFCNNSLDGMKIVICGSSSFRDKMIDYKNRINEMGGVGVIHPDYEAFARGEKQEIWNLIHTDHARAKKENNYIGWYHDAIVNSDAILVLNFEKKGIENYIGGNTLMEIAFAHTNGKKVFLMNPVPKGVSYSDEIAAMYDKVLNEDLSRIEKFKTDSVGSLKDVADRANEIESELDLTFDDVLHKVAQEYGEFNDVVQKFRGRYCRSKVSFDDIKGELGDLIFNLSSVCNRLGINPNDFSLFAKRTLDKFEGRKGDYKK